MSSSSKPSYLGTLNAIVNGERKAFEFLDAWAMKTTNPDLSAMLKTVALREAEHAASFEKRMCELGYEFQEKKDPTFKKTMEIVLSNSDDAEKFEKLDIGLGGLDGEDRLLQLLADKNIDPHTGALLGRFIAEERDSDRLLQKAYQRTKGVGPAPEESVTLSDLQKQLARLTKIVSGLQDKPPKKKPKRRAVK
ncbi:MAG: hypothetical protein CMQ19_05015 [Gammaproteobacteria bacterium]|nr:hypothetical protein [Gammaproteobacteria bacterium]|tara:strand:- start:5093 stop:5671 length:579 start_codon:yes stop_codon:yes gene_type:complete